MKKMKGWLVIVLVIILFVGCTVSSDEDTSEQTEIEQTEMEGAVEVEEIEETQEDDLKAEELDMPEESGESEEVIPELSSPDFDLSSVSEYKGEPYTVINENEPFFVDTDFVSNSFEQYSDLDELGRCGVCFVNVGQDIMPTEERGEIGQIKPTGWHTVKYADLIADLYLYNRCHLIGYQLSGENANEENLITGTRYLNVEGMLPFENKISDYVQETGNHVLYRVTPIFEGDNLVASGVLMEAKSVEDNGEGITFCVYCYNVQPGIEINYADGSSTEMVVIDSTPENIEENNEPEGITYVLNKNTKKFHYPSCSSADDIKPKNRKEITASREEVINMGYDACKRCNP